MRARERRQGGEELSIHQQTISREKGRDRQGGFRKKEPLPGKGKS